VPARTLIVGASLAGLRTAEALREAGYAERLTIVGAEPHAPYDRPPLSKQLLAGACEHDDCTLAHAVEADWLLGRRAVGLDLERRVVALDDGERVDFDALVIATGSRARRWPAADAALEGVFTLRTVEDATRLRAAAAAATRAAIVGAGFIGCEVAATLRAQGLEVDLVDAASQPMTALGPQLGGVCAQLHREHGVRLHLGADVVAFEGDGRFASVRLGDGTRLEADLAVIAIGDVPATRWLRGSAVPLDPSVVCEATCAVRGVPNVFAVGDVASWPHPLLDGRRVCVRHWSNAAEAAAIAAANLLAHPAERRVHDAVPSFWSDQYDVTIRSVGFPSLATGAEVVEGSLENRRFVVAYRMGERPIGAVAFGMARRMPFYRRLIAERGSLTEHAVIR